jgi:hypothetical protein
MAGPTLTSPTTSGPALKIDADDDRFSSDAAPEIDVDIGWSNAD